MKSYIILIALSMLMVIPAHGKFEENDDAPFELPPPREFAKDDDKFLIDLVKKAGEGVGRSLLMDTATGIVDAQIARLLETESSKYASNALAVYSIYKGARAYGKSNSEQEKYFAAAGIVSDILILSGIGSGPAILIKLGLMGQMVSAAYVTKDGYRKMMKDIARAEALDTERLQLVLKRAKGELAYLRTLWLQAVVALKAAEKLQADYQESCSKLEEVVAESKLEACVADVRRIVLLRSIAARHVHDLVHARLDVLSMEKFEELSGLGKGEMAKYAAQLSKAAAHARARVLEVEGAFVTLVTQDRESALAGALAPKRKLVACLRETERTIVPALKAGKYFDSTDAADREILAFKIEEARESYARFCHGVEPMDARMRSTLEKIERRLAASEISER
jgi:hypothetical protein